MPKNKARDPSVPRLVCNLTNVRKLLPLPALLLPPALRLHHGVELVALAVLALEGRLGAVLGLADVDAVDDQPLLAALHLEDELADRGVGHPFEGAADAALLGRVDAADQVDVDLGRV